MVQGERYWADGGMHPASKPIIATSPLKRRNVKLERCDVVMDLGKSSIDFHGASSSRLVNAASLMTVLALQGREGNNGAIVLRFHFAFIRNRS